MCTFTAAAFCVDRHGRRSGQPALRDVSEQLLEPRCQPLAEIAGDAGDHPRRAVPAIEVREERLTGGRAHRLLRSDDVPAERLVAVEALVVDRVDEVPRRVEVHVHLLDDDALLAVDLLGVEPRVAEHVDEDVECYVAVLGRALDVVARVLLAGEGVELAADRVDLPSDLARGRAPLGALEEHVLGEVGDPVRVARLVARPGREHDEAGDRLRLGHGRRQDPKTVPELGALEGVHPSILRTGPRSAAEGAGGERPAPAPLEQRRELLEHAVDLGGRVVVDEADANCAVRKGPAGP